MSVLQFNGSYLNHEDRILFRFNTANAEEYRLCLTRSVLKQLFSSGETALLAKLEASHPSSIVPAVHEFQNGAVAQQSDFKSNFKEGGHFPLGESPILVIGVKVAHEENIVSLDFQLITRQNLNIKIPQANFRALMLLLRRLQDQADWGLGDAQSTMTNPLSIDSVSRLH